MESFCSATKLGGGQFAFLIYGREKLSGEDDVNVYGDNYHYKLGGYKLLFFKVMKQGDKHLVFQTHPQELIYVSKVEGRLGLGIE
ncbi:hypothetical protein [Vibrio mediterranei]|uniref:Uncharacterized protein n=1 Tax=Vibrio mediterranei TaxID=689 RepID=A0ABX5D7D0_9VIBR|nr:hypothetical protein [Vibrio mediterranei]PCD85263.1 hypothetical protein COR52_27680 [Vibrio mediterranei]PRQ64471.1 hypothetical protein COR51_27330 [Vibrio mediterranei]